MKQFSSLLVSLIFFTCCHGQNNTVQKKSQSWDGGHAVQTKLIKTQRTNQYCTVSCGLQDRSGNLWFGTGGEGIYRYDGKTFTNYTTKDGLCSNGVCALLEDKEGNIWIGTTTGLCRYNGKTFTNIQISVDAAGGSYLYNEKALKSSETGVWSMLQDKTGRIWLGTGKDGVYYYDGSNFKHFIHQDGVINESNLSLNAVKSIIQDKAGNIWFATWFEGICRFDGKSIVSLKPKGKVWFDYLFEDSKGNLWIGTRENGAYRYDGKTFTDFPGIDTFSTSCVYSIVEDKEGNIWFASEADKITERDIKGGVWRYDRKTFKNFTTKDGLSDMAVFSITTDRTGKLWFGTHGMGLCNYDGKRFLNFTEKDQAKK